MVTLIENGATVKRQGKHGAVLKTKATATGALTLARTLLNNPLTFKPLKQTTRKYSDIGDVKRCIKL